MEMFRMKRCSGLRVLVPTALIALGGCGGGDAGDAADADTTAPADTATQVSATETQGGSADSQPSAAALMLTADDIELYRRGREAEIAHVRALGDSMAKARTADDSGSIMGSLVDERGRQRAAAARIGIDEQRYLRLVEAVDEVLRKWQGAQMGNAVMKGVDTTQLSDEQRAQMRSMATANYEGLPEQNVQLILPQAPVLDSLRMMPALLALGVAQGRR
jgi:hypothetical protein